MSIMNIGDKVRALRGTEEGFITGFPDKNTVEVEIEDGFRIPMLRKELVVVARDESKAFEKESSAKDTPKVENLGATGLYLTFVETSSQFLELQLVNNTDYKLAVAAFKKMELGKLYGLACETMGAKAVISMGHFDLKKFEHWPPLLLQVLYYSDGQHTPKEPLVKSITFKAANFYKSKAKAPLLNRDAYVFQLDGTNLALHREKLQEQLVEGRPVYDPAASAIEAPEAIVDLHIEKLEDAHEVLNPKDCLSIQIEAFEKALDGAIAAGMPEITFIHGVGNGTLRDHIHKALSKNESIEHFKDAQKEKFGFGATFVKLA